MKNLLLTLIAFAPFFLFSQTSTDLMLNPERIIEELKQQTNLKDPSVKDLENISKIRHAFGLINIDSALYYADIQLTLAKRTQDPNSIAYARLKKSSLLTRKQQPEKAGRLLNKNLKNKKRIADTTYARSLYWMGQGKVQQALYPEGLDFVIKASKIYEKLNDSINSSQCYSFIAGLHTFITQEPEKAIFYFDKAILFNGDKNELNTIQILINYSGALEQTSDLKGAIGKLKEAERLSKRPENSVYLSSVYVQFAAIYSRMENHEKSFFYTLKADSIAKVNPHVGKRTQLKIQWYLALSYKVQKNYPEAIRYFESLKDIRLLDPWDIRQHLIDIYEETGEYDKAFHLQREITQAKDSIHEITRDARIMEITERYENEKKEQEIVTLNAEKELKDNKIRTQERTLYGIIGFFIVLGVIGIFWYRTRMTLKETALNLKTTRLQQRFLRTQLNPHFLFHALTSIESYMYKNDVVRSADFLRNFSTLMRNILEFSEFDFIPLRHDIDFIEKYMKLQQLSHENKFTYEISVSSDLKTEEIDIPPMLIQPAVENAILHGALNTEDGKVWIDFSKVENQLQIDIGDNGKRSSSNLNSTNKLNKSMSLDITQTRIKNLREVHGVQIDYTPFDFEENGDSCVRFILPL